MEERGESMALDFGIVRRKRNSTAFPSERLSPALLVPHLVKIQSNEGASRKVGGLFVFFLVVPGRGCLEVMESLERGGGRALPRNFRLRRGGRKPQFPESARSPLAIAFDVITSHSRRWSERPVTIPTLAYRFGCQFAARSLDLRDLQPRWRAFCSSYTRMG